MQQLVGKMYCSTIITITSHYFVYTFIELLASAAAADKSTRDRQQPMLLHSWPQSETWCWKKYARYSPGQIKLVGGPDAARRP